MISKWNLPQKINVSGEEYEIRTDFRDILNCLIAFNDPDVDEITAQAIMLKTIYKEWDKIPAENIKEAAQKAASFIDAGTEEDEKNTVRLVDWEKDAQIMVSSINAVAGKEVRSVPHLHWWTFIGYYMEIKDGLFSQILNIRQKRAQGKKLEKWEMEFYQKNKNIIDLNKQESRSKEEKDELKRLFGLNK